MMTRLLLHFGTQGTGQDMPNKHVHLIVLLLVVLGWMKDIQSGIIISCLWGKDTNYRGSSEVLEVMFAFRLLPSWTLRFVDFQDSPPLSMCIINSSTDTQPALCRMSFPSSGPLIYWPPLAPCWQGSWNYIIINLISIPVWFLCWMELELPLIFPHWSQSLIIIILVRQGPRVNK